MPTVYDLNHSKYTVQKITNEWKKIRITTLVRNNGNKKSKKKQNRLQLIHNIVIYISKKYM